MGCFGKKIDKNQSKNENQLEDNQFPLQPCAMKVESSIYAKKKEKKLKKVRILLENLNGDSKAQPDVSARIQQLALPRVRKLVASRESYRPFLNDEWIGRYDKLIKESLFSKYSQLGKTQLPPIPESQKSQKMTEADWKRHEEWLKLRAQPKYSPRKDQAFTSKQKQKKHPKKEFIRTEFLSAPKYQRSKFSGVGRKVSDPIRKIPKSTLLAQFDKRPWYRELQKDLDKRKLEGKSRREEISRRTEGIQMVKKGPRKSVKKTKKPKKSDKKKDEFFLTERMLNLTKLPDWKTKYPEIERYLRDLEDVRRKRALNKGKITDEPPERIQKLTKPPKWIQELKDLEEFERKQEAFRRKHAGDRRRINDPPSERILELSQIPDRFCGCAAQSEMVEDLEWARHCRACNRERIMDPPSDRLLELAKLNPEDLAKIRQQLQKKRKEEERKARAFRVKRSALRFQPPPDSRLNDLAQPKQPWTHPQYWHH